MYCTCNCCSYLHNINNLLPFQTVQLVKNYIQTSYFETKFYTHFKSCQIFWAWKFISEPYYVTSDNMTLLTSEDTDYTALQSLNLSHQQTVELAQAIQSTVRPPETQCKWWDWSEYHTRIPWNTESCLSAFLSKNRAKRKNSTKVYNAANANDDAGKAEHTSRFYQSQVRQ